MIIDLLAGFVPAIPNLGGCSIGQRTVRALFAVHAPPRLARGSVVVPAAVADWPGAGDVNRVTRGVFTTRGLGACAGFRLLFLSSVQTTAERRDCAAAMPDNWMLPWVEACAMEIAARVMPRLARPGAY